ncbi:MAG: GerW family sporulation protein [Clostridia bacterium]|nr:GerW family sporulation protein [Clostridia bacterium]
MSEHPIDNMLDKTMQKIKEMVDINTIIGDPIAVGDTTIIPISKVTYGFASGGSEFSNKKESETKLPLFGGGSGAGVTISPVAFLTIADSKVSILRVEPSNSSIDRVIDMLPGAIDKISSSFKKKDKVEAKIKVSPKAEIL